METDKEKIEKLLPRYQIIIEAPVLYENYKDAIREWDFTRWPHFSPDESTIACPLTNNFYLDPIAFDYLEHARSAVGKPFIINSGHRSLAHNKEIGGVVKSAHLKIAFDISLKGHNRKQLYKKLKVAGFTCFGFYKTFIHTDTRVPARSWYGKDAKQLWNL